MPEGKVGQLYQDFDGNYITKEQFENLDRSDTGEDRPDSRPATNSELQRLERMDRVVNGELPDALVSDILIKVSLDTLQDMIQNFKYVRKAKINKDYHFIISVGKN